MALMKRSAFERRYACYLGFDKSARSENEPYQFMGAAPPLLKSEV
jgi:hypothetical protein